MSREEEQGNAIKERKRLEPRDKSPQLSPFVRATKLTDIALYWLPVRQYPMRSPERQWILAFLARLKSKLAAAKKLRLETFLQFKALYPDLLDLFLSRSMEYQPMTGLLLQPGAKPPELPAAKDIEAEVAKGGGVDVNQWMAEYCYWFMAKQDEQQRKDFLGAGGMMFLFMEADPNAKPPDIKISKVMRTHPAFKDVDIQGKMAIASSMQDKFLKQSKETFGETVRQEPAYPGIPYILPLLASEDFFRATPDQRTQWFDVFAVYCIESKPDKGILIAAKDLAFDDILIELLQDLREAGIEYPL